MVLQIGQVQPDQVGNMFRPRGLYMDKRLMKGWKTIGILWMKTLGLTSSQVSTGELFANQPVK